MAHLAPAHFQLLAGLFVAAGLRIDPGTVALQQLGGRKSAMAQTGHLVTVRRVKMKRQIGAAYGRLKPAVSRVEPPCP